MMERLTKRMPDPSYCACENVILAKCENCMHRMEKCSDEDCKTEIEVNVRLAAYEDTGLEPDEIPHWIPVSERLPEVNTRVLVWGKEHKEAVVAVFNEDGIWAIAHGWGVVYGVTHWMPLPQPPKEAE